MSLSLGEKLRQAREQRSISVSEVAEQTRISPLYLEAIDADNYKTLPGGIFNKGFVRSYAKYVGVDEQEALQDYSRLLAEHEEKEENKYQSYRPEVLTDDRAGSSMVPTVIFAVVILGLMTAGILFLVNYIQNQQSRPPVTANTSNINTSNPANSNSIPTIPASQVPTMQALKVEFTAVGGDVSLTSVTDNGKSSEKLIEAGAPIVFEPKESIKLRYSKSRAEFAHLTLNGKQIMLPTQPANPKASTIELRIDQENLAQIWQSGAISFGTEPASSTPVSTNASRTTVITPAADNTVATPTGTETPKSSPKPVVTPKATSPANGNTASAPRSTPPAQPTMMSTKPTANGVKPN